MPRDAHAEAEARLDSVAFSLADLPIAVELLLDRSALPRRSFLPPPLHGTAPAAIESWIATSAAGHDLDCVASPIRLGSIDSFLAGVAPGLLVVRTSDSNGTHLPRVLVFGARSASGTRLLLHAPGGDVWVGHSVLAQWIRDFFERAAPLPPGWDGLGIPGIEASLRTSRSARQGSLHGVTFRLPPTAPFLAQLRTTGFARHAVVALTASAAQAVLTLGAEYLLGSPAIEGRADAGRVLGWALLLLTTIPFALLVLRATSFAALEAAILVKRRLLVGAMRIDVDDLRRRGIGEILALVGESESVERLGVTDVVGGVAPLVQLVASAWLLLATLPLGLVPLGGVLVSFAVVARRVARARSDWNGKRIRLTATYVEKIQGFKTRRIQEPPPDWHRAEDADLSEYIRSSRGLDGWSTAMTSLPRVFFFAAALVLGEKIVSSGYGPAAALTGTEGLGLLAAVVAVLLAYGAIQGLVAATASLVAAGVSLGAVRALFAAGRQDSPPPFAVPPAPAGERRAGHLVDAKALTFGYGPAAVLKGLTFDVPDDARILLRGGSGSGKTTLISLLAGLRQPTSGLLLVGGLDRHALPPDEWRRRIATSPQYYENHLFSHVLAYNLLLARAWPPKPEDLARADRVCRALQLGPLLDRMPNGLMQFVGESGWQLSHGERSRVFLARTLLQDADFVILDETLGSLDPENADVALACALTETRALMLVSHG